MSAGRLWSMSVLGPLKQMKPFLNEFDLHQVLINLYDELKDFFVNLLFY